MSTIEIEIDEEGNVTFLSKGIKGRSCLKELAKLTAVLGISEDPVPTAELYQAEAQTVTQKAGR